MVDMCISRSENRSQHIYLEASSNGLNIQKENAEENID